jgi:hypothetical protein
MRRKAEDSSAQVNLFGGEVLNAYAEEMYPQRRIMLSSGSEHWCTSNEVLEPLREFAPIVFDPFSNPFSIVGAERSIMLPEDSLLIDWPLEGLIFCNPPYGDALFDCARKIGEQARRGCQIATLVPARVDTEWWQKLLGPVLWCAWTGRIKFLETRESLWARYLKRCEAAKQQNRPTPAEPVFKMVTEQLAEGESATFPSALCYAGPANNHFIHRFAKHGEMYQRIAA